MGKIRSVPRHPSPRIETTTKILSTHEEVPRIRDSQSSPWPYKKVSHRGHARASGGMIRSLPASGSFVGLNTVDAGIREHRSHCDGNSDGTLWTLSS